MEKNSEFSYTYSAVTNQEVQEIRKKYVTKEESKMDELRRLDHQVQTSGMIPSLTFGIIGFLLFGSGVCMTTKVIGGNIILGVFLGGVGLVAMLFAYPVYRSLFNKAKDKFVPRILELTSELIAMEGK